MRVAAVRTAQSVATAQKSSHDMREKIVTSMIEALESMLPMEPALPTTVSMRAMRAMGLFDRDAARWRFLLGRGIQSSLNDVDRVDHALSSVLHSANANLDAMQRIADAYSQQAKRDLSDPFLDQALSAIEKSLKCATSSLRLGVHGAIRDRVASIFSWQNGCSDELEAQDALRSAIVDITDPDVLEEVMESIKARQQSIIRGELQQWISNLHDFLSSRRKEQK